MTERLTKKEKEFADEYIETGNATQSALKAYDTEDYSTAGVIGHDNLKKPKILTYMEKYVESAQSNIIALAEGADNETVRLNANKDVLDRVQGKAVTRTELGGVDGQPLTVMFDNSFNDETT